MRTLRLLTLLLAACTTHLEDQGKPDVLGPDAGGDPDAVVADAGAMPPDAIVDRAAPETTVLSAPAGTVRAVDADITFRASEPSSFECRVDEGSWAACASPFLLRGLESRAHLVEVRAKDLAGNVDATPAQARWTIDAIAPVVRIGGTPVENARTRIREVALTFDSDEPVTYQCSRNGAPFVDCGPSLAYSEAGLDGDYQIAVRAVDAAGNPSETTRNYTLDTTGAELTWISSFPAQYCNTVKIAFLFSFDEAVDTISVLIVGLTGNGVETLRPEVTSFRTPAGELRYRFEVTLARGTFDIEVQVSDVAGNLATERWDDFVNCGAIQ